MSVQPPLVRAKNPKRPGRRPKYKDQILVVPAAKKPARPSKTKTYRIVEQMVMRSELIRMYAPERLATFGNANDEGDRSKQHIGAMDVATAIVSACPFYRGKTARQVDALRKWLTDPGRSRFPFSDAMLRQLFPGSQFGRNR